ncbi:hypothetical protein B0H13DRAFT_1907358 [Mycena leptocephala]|nr:hypothetical protein B0H13DRAFT_1907358 [Mycena leptocephala]
MVGTSRDDHLRIHKRFPFLALLLSACNPSTIIVGLVWRTDIPPDDVFLKSRIQIDGYKHITVVLHGAAMAAAGLAIWQAVILGMRGVVAFACPTWYNPLIWVLVGPVGHIIDVVFIRWCIEGRRHRWRWNLSAVDGLKIRRPWVMRSKDMILTVLALADYVYGTVTLSSMQLVAPRPALQIVVVFALAAMFTRLISVFILEFGPQDHQNSAHNLDNGWIELPKQRMYAARAGSICNKAVRQRGLILRTTPVLSGRAFPRRREGSGGGSEYGRGAFDHRTLSTAFLIHRTLLPATIQCLSRIPLNDWHTMPATTNLGEAQHARNNAETGTQMGIIESFNKYAEYDARRAAEINVKLATGNLNNNQNELVQRYASSNRHHAAATDKGMRARDSDERVIALRQAKAQVEAELKRATAEAKSNSSGRVPARRPSKGKTAKTNTQGKLNAKQASALREDEHEGMQGEELQMGDETSGQQISDTYAPIEPNLHRQHSTLPRATRFRQTPNPKRRKAGDPLAGWAIELVPGDKTTAVIPREYAEKDPEEFAAQYPQYVKFL